MPYSELLPETRPISDLRTKLNEIEALAKKTRGPVIMTKNGTASLVVMDSEAFNERLLHERLVRKLREAEIEERLGLEPLGHDELIAYIEGALDAVEGLGGNPS